MAGSTKDKWKLHVYTKNPLKYRKLQNTDTIHNNRIFEKRRLLFFISEKGGSEDGGYDRKRTDHGFN